MPKEITNNYPDFGKLSKVFESYKAAARKDPLLPPDALDRMFADAPARMRAIRRERLRWALAIASLAIVTLVLILFLSRSQSLAPVSQHSAIGSHPMTEKIGRSDEQNDKHFTSLVTANFTSLVTANFTSLVTAKGTKSESLLQVRKEKRTLVQTKEQLNATIQPQYAGDALPFPRYGDTLFSSDFENTAIGEFPFGAIRRWAAVGCRSSGVVTTEHHSGQKSLQLSADPNGCYEAAMDIPVPTLSSKMRIEFWMMCKGNYSSGCHKYEGGAQYSIGIKGASSEAIGEFEFSASPSRKFRLLDSTTAMTWMPMKWYKVDLDLDTTAKTLSLSINDRLIVTRSSTFRTSSQNYQHCIIGSGDATVWVDDVVVTRK